MPEANASSDSWSSFVAACLRAEEKLVFKANPDFVVRQIGDEFLLVPTGKFAQDFNGMISLNETGHYLIERFATPTTLGEVLNQAAQEFDDPEHQLSHDIRYTVRLYLHYGLLQEVMPDKAPESCERIF